MLNYEVPDNYIVNISSASEGVQTKMVFNDFYYKVDNKDEGIGEFLTTLVLNNSTLNPNEFVSYERCFINGKQGCRCKSFLKSTETFVSMNKVYFFHTGLTNLSDKLFSIYEINDRLKYLTDLSESVNIDTNLFKDYLNKMLQLDMLICNTDRHHNNYGFIYDFVRNTYRLAPIFDNGNSLVEGEATTCTISGSPFNQVTVFGFPVKAAFQIHYDKLFNELKNNKDIQDNRKTIFLQKQLEKYESLFRQDNKHI